MSVRILALCVILPIAGGVIGYVTKRAAVTLLFWPPVPRRFGPVVWQGVIQRRAPKLAGDLSSTLSGAALDSSDLAARIDSDEVARRVEEAIRPDAPLLARGLSETIEPGSWDRLDDDDRDARATGVAQALGDGIREIVDADLPAIADQVDFGAILEEGLLGSNGDHLARLLRRLATRELQVLIRYGALLGFLIGAVQIGIYLSFERWWVLLVVGAIDGLVNNFLAIQMIFLPRERRKLLGLFPVQGLFPARRQEVAAEFAEFVADILTPRRIGEQMARDGLVLTVLPSALSKMVERIAPALCIGTSERSAVAVGEALPRALLAELQLQLPGLLESIEPYLTKALDVQALVEEKLSAMPPRDFERLLRGIFEEDERVLIGLGGVLGAAIGSVEAGIVVGLGL